MAKCKKKVSVNVLASPFPAEDNELSSEIDGLVRYRGDPAVDVEACYECGACGKQCRLLHNLRNHIERVHLSLGPVNCVACGKTFVNKFSLRKHVLRKHREQAHILK